MLREGADIIRCDGQTDRMNFLITRSVYGDVSRGFIQYQFPIQNIFRQE